MRSCVLLFKSSIRYSCQIWLKLELYRHISKKYSVSVLMKIIAVATETDGRTDRDRQTDGRTDTTKLIVAFSSFAKAPKNIRSTKQSLPCVVRLSTSGRSPGIPERAVIGRLTHCHPSDWHGTHTVGLGIVFQGLLLQIRYILRKQSPLVWCGSSPRTNDFEWREAIFVRTCHPWRIASSQSQAGSITLR